jgi:hypothetical protein
MTAPKFCPSCELELPLEDFQTDRRLKSGKKTYCRKCANEKTKDWQKRNPERRRAAKRRELDRDIAKRAEVRASLPPKPPALPWNKTNPKGHYEAQRRYKAKNADKLRISSLRRLHERKREDPEGWKLRMRRNSLRVMGHTIESFDALLAEQDNKCAICRLPPNGERKMAIDHDHKCCGKGRACIKCVRGLLCAPCNTALHKLENMEDWTYRALQYLDGHAAK